jgi:hypothetical protein
VAPNPDRELAEARAAIDRGDAHAALKRLDRARRGYVKGHDADGLEHLLMLADVLDPNDERARIGRINLEYALKQNLRQESRRHALLAGGPWTDPYPALEAPTEHTGIAFTRGVKLAIAIGTAIGALVLVAIFVLPIVFSSSTTSVTVRLVNDTQHQASVSGCDDPTCTSTWTHADLRAERPRPLPAASHPRRLRAPRLGYLRRARRPPLEGDALPRADCPAGSRAPDRALGRYRGKVAGRPRPHSEQSVIQRVDQRRAVAVRERLHEGLPDRVGNLAVRRLAAGERPEARELFGPLVPALAEQHRRAHRRGPEAVGPAEQRSQGLAQLLGAVWLVREERQLPAIERFGELRVFL